MNRLWMLVVVLSLVGSCSDAAAPSLPSETKIMTSTTTTAAPVTTTASPTSSPIATTAAPTTTTSTTTTTTTTATTTTTTTAAPPPTTTTTTAAPTTTTTAVDYVAVGSQLATDNGCRNCHSTDGSIGIGPSWAGLAGSTVSLDDGSTVTAGNSYLIESIKSPDAKIVAGFAPGVMQTYFLSDEEIQALVAYISSR